MAELIPVGNTATLYSAGEFTVPAGSNVTLLIKGAADGGVPPGVEFEIARKTSGGQYITLITLSNINIITQGVVQGGASAQIYAARRKPSGSVSAGLDWA